MAVTIDNMKAIAKKALEETSVEPSPVVIPKSGKAMVEELRENRLVLCGVFHTKIVDNFLTYLCDILMEVFQRRPEIMKSKAKIEIEEVIDAALKGELFQSISEQIVHEMGFKPFEKLNEFIVDRLGIDLADKDLLDDIKIAIETRNLIVHNRGIRNKRYISRVKENSDQLGKKRDIGIEYNEKVHSILLKYVLQMDKSIRKKHKISGLRFFIEKEFRGKGH